MGANGKHLVTINSHKINLIKQIEAISTPDRKSSCTSCPCAFLSVSVLFFHPQTSKIITNLITHTHTD